MATDLKFEKYSTIAHSFWQSIYEDNDEKTARSTTNMKDQKNITNNNQRLAECVRSLVKVFFLFYRLRRENNRCLQVKAAKKTFACEIEAICAT